MGASYVNQNIRAFNGKYVVLPVWKGADEDLDRPLTHPDVYVLDTSQEYPIGTKFVDGDRVFHYGYIYSDDGAADRGGIGCGDLNEMKSTTTDAVVEDVGETEIVIEDSASTLNQWAGGYFWPYVAPYYTGYRVLGNTATSGGHVTLTLERGLLQATTASLALNELYANPYSKLDTCWVTGKDYTSCMGIALPTPVASRYMWLQTWGPCIVAGGDEEPGGTSQYRAAGINIDGTLVIPTQHYGQRIGHVINSTSTSHVASHFVMLQITP